MILHRFMSLREYTAYKRGELLTNTTRHSDTRGSATTSVGFCWFSDNPEVAKHRLSGIVDFDICLTVQVQRKHLTKSRGRYCNQRYGRHLYMSEYCCTEYDNERFQEVHVTTKYKGYAPNARDLRIMFPWIF